MNEKKGPGSPLQAILLIPVFAALYAIQSEENLAHVTAIIQLFLSGKLWASDAEAVSNAATHSAPQLLTAIAAIFVCAVLIIGIGAAFRRWANGKRLIDSTMQKIDANQDKGQSKGKAAPLRRTPHKSVIGSGKGGFLE